MDFPLEKQWHVTYIDLTSSLCRYVERLESTRIKPTKKTHHIDQNEAEWIRIVPNHFLPQKQWKFSKNGFPVIVYIRKEKGHFYCLKV